MITFEDFDGYIERLRNFRDSKNSYQEKLDDVFNCYVDVSYDEELFELTIDLLKRLLGLSKESQDIEYFVYDCSFGEEPGKVWVDDKEYEIRNSKNVYDFILDSNVHIM